jgi:hypothetical protein
MASNNFFLVPQIVASDKYFDVSMAEINRALIGSSGKFDRAEEQTITDEYGVDHEVLVKINVNCQSVVPEGWTIALKVHKERVDGFDHEPEFDAIDGTKASGWHRHQWDQRQQTAKYIKIPISDFDGVDSREQFVIRAFNLMRIKVNRTDHGYQLPIS